LLALRDKSLINVESGYFELHQLLRQFAAEKLNADEDEAIRIKKAHSAYYAARLAQYEIRLFSDLLTQAVQELARDIENIRAAWQFAVLQRDMTLIGQFLKPLYNYFDVQCWHGSRRCRGPCWCA